MVAGITGSIFSACDETGVAVRRRIGAGVDWRHGGHDFHLICTLSGHKVPVYAGFDTQKVN